MTGLFNKLLTGVNSSARSPQGWPEWSVVGRVRRKTPDGGSSGRALARRSNGPWSARHDRPLGPRRRGAQCRRRDDTHHRSRRLPRYRWRLARRELIIRTTSLTSRFGRATRRVRSVNGDRRSEKEERREPKGGRGKSEGESRTVGSVSDVLFARAVVRRFVGDDDVVRVAFLLAGRRDPDEFRARLESGDRLGADVAHPRLHATH